MLKRRPFQEFLAEAELHMWVPGAFDSRKATEDSGSFYAPNSRVVVWGTHTSGHVSLPESLHNTYTKGLTILLRSAAVGCEDHDTASIEFDQNSQFVNGFDLHGNSQYPFDWLILVSK